MVDISRWRLTPFQHQITGVEKLVVDPTIGLWDEMGLGKSAQVINAAQTLYTSGVINCVIVIAPLAVLDVWFDQQFGELTRHLWADIPVWMTKLRNTRKTWKIEGESPLRWVVTNYDYARNHAKEISAVCDRKTLLVLDESSAVSSWKSLQTKACEHVRKHVGRVIELNGTPISNNPTNLYSQAHLLNPAILGCSSFYHFRARYCVMGGFKNKQIVKFVNLDDMQKRLAPYVLRRLKADCLDLPEKLLPVTLSVALSAKSWDIYREMRDELVAWLSTQHVSSAPQAMTKAIRLAQVCSGFLGGVVDVDSDGVPLSESRVEIIGSEKLNMILQWHKERLDEDPSFRVVYWCRFRAEVERLGRALPRPVGLIYGGQRPEDRGMALRLMDPRTAPDGPASAVGTPASGSMGITLAAADTVVYLSNDFNLKNRLQADDRCHRLGQTHTVSYFDVVATGPNGQKTIDHTIIKRLRSKEDLATLTCSEWISELETE